MKEVTAFFTRLRGYLVDPRANGPELLVSVGLLLVIIGMLAIIYMWVRFKLVQRKHKALRRQQKEIQDQKQAEEDLESEIGFSESDQSDPESIIESLNIDHLDSAPKSEVAGADLADPAARDIASGSSFRRRRWRPWHTWISASIILLILLVLIVTVPRYTMGKVSYCSACHAMENAVNSWRKSNHSKVGCRRCHEPPGIGGIITSQLQGLSNVSLSSLYWRRHRPITLKTPVSFSCLSCHEDISTKIISYNDSIKVSHKEFISFVACEGCHPDAGHKGKKIKTTMMNICVTCHVENQAGVTCITCHQPEPVWSATRLSKYAKATLPFRTTCKKCHESEMRCMMCHKPPPPPDDD